MGTSADDIAKALFGLIAPAQPRLRVPGNLVPVIRAVSDQTGVPFEVIAGVIQTEVATGTSGDWPLGVTSDLIVQVASAIQQDLVARRGRDPRISAKRVFGGDRTTWLERFDSIVYARDREGKPDLDKPEWIEREPSIVSPGTRKITVPRIGSFGGYTIDLKGPERNLTRSDLAEALRRGLISPSQYRSALLDLGYSDEEADMVMVLDTPTGGRGVDVEDVRDAAERFLGRPLSDEEARSYIGMPASALRAALIALPEAKTWREMGPKIQQARRWADRLWFDYYGREPTNAEVAEIISRGHTPDSLQRYLSDQPVGSTTLGQLRSVREIADRYALEHVGRRSDEGEVNWLITSKITTPEGISAFYEQLKQRIDTGDPNFAWATDPKSWRTMRSQLQSLWQRAGMIGEIDPHLVNRAVSQKWDARTAQDYIDDLPAPGYEDVSVGEVRRVRSIAEPWKEQYLPGQKLTKEEVRLFIDKNSQDIRRYYRSLPVSLRRNFKPESKAHEEVAAGGPEDRGARVSPILEYLKSGLGSTSPNPVSASPSSAAPEFPASQWPGGIPPWLKEAAAGKTVSPGVIEVPSGDWYVNPTAGQG